MLSSTNDNNDDSLLQSDTSPKPPITPTKPATKDSTENSTSSYDFNRHAAKLRRLQPYLQNKTSKQWRSDWWEYVFDEEDYKHQDELVKRKRLPPKNNTTTEQDTKTNDKDIHSSDTNKSNVA